MFADGYREEEDADMRDEYEEKDEEGQEEEEEEEHEEGGKAPERDDENEKEEAVTDVGHMEPVDVDMGEAPPLRSGT